MEGLILFLSLIGIVMLYLIISTAYKNIKFVLDKITKLEKEVSTLNTKLKEVFDEVNDLKK